jgi:predicted alpha/beta superfamily hydrolase
MTPEIFAPGIVSTEKNEINSVFSPDGKEFFFARRNGSRLMMYFSRNVNGIWTKPKEFPYCEGTFNGDMNYSPDGNRLYYCSNRKTDASLGDLDIWNSERTETGWSEPVNLGIPVNSLSSETYPLFTQNGGLYFGSNREGTRGDKDVYYSRFIDGKYTQPIPLGDAINSDYGEGDTYVSFDESFMVINSWGRPDGFGRGDLYISFKLADEIWSRAKNMGERINTEYLEFCPMLSPDGKYLFFTSYRKGNGDIYWVDAKVIEAYKPENYEIQSQVLRETRVITVVLPESYERSKKKYAALYLLDAEWSVDKFNSVVLSMFEKDEIPELMIVGIRNIDEDTRLRDLTPTPMEKYPGSGGSDKFLLFLAREVIPFIEDKFRTTSPRILFGHSSGGLFTTYALIKNPDVFAGYIASSPGLSWDNELVLKRASQMFKENPDLNKFLYLGVGTKDYRTYMASTENFARILKSEAPPSLSWVYRVFEGEDHTTMPDKSFPDGLVWFFQKYKKRLQGLIS